MAEPVILKGVFNWQRRERISNRYGGILLDQHAANVNEGESAPCVDLSALAPLVGRKVRITATVLETRESYHIGDLFRDIYPSTPNVNDYVVLGRGDLIGIERDDNGCEQLIFRRESRRNEASDWMDPRKLYRLHNQTVELTIIPIEGLH